VALSPTTNGLKRETREQQKSSLALYQHHSSEASWGPAQKETNRVQVVRKVRLVGEALPSTVRDKKRGWVTGGG